MCEAFANLSAGFGIAVAIGQITEARKTAGNFS